MPAMKTPALSRASGLSGDVRMQTAGNGYANEVNKEDSSRRVPESPTTAKIFTYKQLLSSIPELMPNDAQIQHESRRLHPFPGTQVARVQKTYHTSPPPHATTNSIGERKNTNSYFNLVKALFITTVWLPSSQATASVMALFASITLNRETPYAILF